MNLNFFTKIFGGLENTSRVVTRIAPSPTGTLHIGTARTALFNFLVAKKCNGTFIMRIEDTDKERSTKAYEEDILTGLAWLGITHDSLYRQSERVGIYTTYLEKMISNGTAYVSKEKSTAQEGKMVEVVRLKNPGEDVTFTDKIRGDITFNTKELGDFVIARSLTEPLYHLAVVIDDYDMNVTHVIRGEDHISNTPRQILIQRALSIPEPIYAHIPLILASDRSKMSKRKGSTSIQEYRENGYLPEALINYLALLGWNPGTEKELFSMDELIQEFSLENVQKGGAVFDIKKLNWFNQEHLRALPQNKIIPLIEGVLPERVMQLPLYSRDMLSRLVETLTERVSTLGELAMLARAGEFDYFFSPPTHEASLTWKDDTPQVTKKHLSHLVDVLGALPETPFTKEVVKDAVWDYAEREGKGSVLWPTRVALSGKDKSPDPFTLTEILGKEETLIRLKNAIELL